MKQTIELGIVDSLWDVSFYVNSDYIDFWASSPHGRNNGWYRALISLDGKLLQEKRMLASGNYDLCPETSRPNLQIIFDAIPPEHKQVIQTVKKTYKIEGK